MENFHENKPFNVKSSFWQIQSVKVTVDRQGHIASVYLLLANPAMHQYTKKVYQSISDFVQNFGNPAEFSEKGISDACVGTWVESSEYIEILDEEPNQTKSMF